jgi:hypothetical protein
MTPSKDNAQPSKDDAKLNVEDTPSPEEVPDVSFLFYSSVHAPDFLLFLL